MLTLITGEEHMQDLLSLLDWHSSFIKEVHWTNSQYQADAGSTICGPAVLLRVLVVLPEDSCALELIAFAPEQFVISMNHDLDEKKTATVKRRSTEADFGAFSVKCGCLAYQKLSVESVGVGQYYNNQDLFDHDGDLLEPYNVDWRSALDAACCNS